MWERDREERADIVS